MRPHVGPQARYMVGPHPLSFQRDFLADTNPSVASVLPRLPEGRPLQPPLRGGVELLRGEDKLVPAAQHNLEPNQENPPRRGPSATLPAEWSDDALRDLRDRILATRACAAHIEPWRARTSARLACTIRGRLRRIRGTVCPPALGEPREKSIGRRARRQTGTEAR